MFKVVERKPGMVHDILECLAKDVPKLDRDGGPVNIPDWCVCTKCRQMPTLIEEKCCGFQAQHCISESPVCWNNNNSFMSFSVL